MSSSHALEVSPPRPAGSDDPLVARIRAGDQAAFEALFRAHHEALWRFAYHQVGCAEAAREIVQDVFFALWRKRAEWEVTTSVTGWLYGAVRHHILRHRRTVRTMARLADRAARDPDEGVAMGTPARDAQATLEAHELDAAVSAVLAALPERRRLAMTLRWKHDLPAPEIARVLGTTPQAVRHLLMRAREEMAALLGARGA